MDHHASPSQTGKISRAVPHPGRGVRYDQTTDRGQQGEKQTPQLGGQDKSRKVRRGRMMGTLRAFKHPARGATDDLRLPRLPNTLELRDNSHFARAGVVTRDDDLRARLGRVRDGGAAASRQDVHCSGANLGREGRRTSLPLSWRFAWDCFRSRPGDELRSWTRRATSPSKHALCDTGGGERCSAHASDICAWDGATGDGATGRMFDAEGDDVDHRAFAERCEGDRHHGSCPAPTALG
jgi:hypothetical protein